MMLDRLRDGWGRKVTIGASSLLAIAGTLLLIGPTSFSVATRAFLEGAFGSPVALGSTLSLAAPTLLCAVGAMLPFRAGLFMLGQPGQYVLGALTAGIVTAAFPGPDALAIAAGLAAAMLVGAAWSGINELGLRIGVDVLVLSLMLNYIADQVATFLSRRVFGATDSGGLFATERLRASRMLPKLVERTSLHSGVLIALAVTLVALWLLRDTVAGHRVRMFGTNPVAATVAGTSNAQLYHWTLAAGGAVCGLAGALQVLGVFGRYVNGSLVVGPTTPAWTGIIVAAVVGYADLVVIPVALAFAVLGTGLGGVERATGINSRLSLVIEAAILLTVATMRRGAPLPQPRRRATATPEPEADATPTPPREPARD